jgi:hypothetical protein
VSSERAAADPREQIAQHFRRFAREVADRSALYVEICEAVAATPWILDFLAAMPEAKWQPNVLLAVVRYLFGTPDSDGSASSSTPRVRAGSGI